MKFSNNEPELTQTDLNNNKTLMNNLLDHKVDRKEIIGWNLSLMALMCTLTFSIATIQINNQKDSINNQKDSINSLRDSINSQKDSINLLTSEVKDLRKNVEDQKDRIHDLEKQILLNRIQELKN